MLGQLVDCLVNPRSSFLRLKFVGRVRLLAGEQPHQRGHVILAAGRPARVEANHPVPLITSLGVDRLIRGDRVQPRPELPSLVELVTLQMDLKKRQLENILGHGRVAQIATQITVYFTFVTMDQLVKKLPIVRAAVIEQQPLVARAAVRTGPGRARPVKL